MKKVYVLDIEDHYLYMDSKLIDILLMRIHDLGVLSANSKTV